MDSGLDPIVKDITTGPHLARIILERIDEIGWTINRLAREIGVLHPSLYRALHAQNSMLYEQCITALGGLRHEEFKGRMVVVWGPPPEA